MAEGEVNNAGEYVLTDGMRLSDLLFKAGGFRESAYTKEAEVVRREISRRGPGPDAGPGRLAGAGASGGGGCDIP